MVVNGHVAPYTLAILTNNLDRVRRYMAVDDHELLNVLTFFAQTVFSNHQHLKTLICQITLT